MIANARLEELDAYSAYLNKLMPIPTDRNYLTPDENELRTKVITSEALDLE